MFDVIIIGGGLGGLTAGARLAKEGKKVLLLEQHFIIGGCATAFKRKEYVMDVGLHEMDGLNQDDHLKNELFSILKLKERIDLVSIPELYEVVLPSGEKLRIPHGEKNLREFLKARYPDEVREIDTFLRTIKQVQKEFGRIPPEGIKRTLSYPFMPLFIPNSVYTSSITVGDWMDRHISNEELKLVLTANLGYYSDNPYTMNMNYFAAASAGYFLGGAWYIKGSGQKLSNELGKIIEENGGQVLTNKKVTEILVNNTQVVGVGFEDTFNNYGKTTVYADSVISNIAPEITANMLPEQFSNKLKKKTKEFKPATSLITIYLGFKKSNLKEYGVESYSTFIQGRKVEQLTDLPGSYADSFDSENKGFVFVDYGQIDSKLAPKGQTFACICTTDQLSNWEYLSPEEYKKEKKRVGKELLKRLESHYPNILESLDYMEVGTAKTIQNYIKTPNGTPYGYDQTIKQGAMKRPHLKSPVKGLYFAGAWTFPGGGFTGAIASGSFTAKKVLNTAVFTTKTSENLPDERIVKLVDKKEVAKNTIELTVEKPRDFHFAPGKYVELKINNPRYTDLDVPHRALSIASHPDEEYLKFTMKYSDSSYKKSIREMNIGETFTIFGPMGDFNLKNIQKDITFLIAGVGITPIIPMLKELQKQKYEKKVTIIYTNSYKEDIAYEKELSQDFGFDVNLKLVITRELGGERINLGTLRNNIKDLPNNDYYIVGGRAFGDSMECLLNELNIGLSNIYADSFY
ncbi:FAD-dependent oxidoreductase [Listeria monocytogenes]